MYMVKSLYLLGGIVALWVLSRKAERQSPLVSPSPTTPSSSVVSVPTVTVPTSGTSGLPYDSGYRGFSVVGAAPSKVPKSNLAARPAVITASYLQSLGLQFTASGYQNSSGYNYGLNAENAYQTLYQQSLFY